MVPPRVLVSQTCPVDMALLLQNSRRSKLTARTAHLGDHVRDGLGGVLVCQLRGRDAAALHGVEVLFGFQLVGPRGRGAAGAGRSGAAEDQPNFS